MARDTRELLEIGVGEAHDLPDAALFWQQGRRRAWKRRAASTLVVAAVLTLMAAVGPTLIGHRGGQVEPVNEPPQTTEPTALRVGQLEPGRYEAGAWSPPFTFQTSDDSWRVVENDSDWIALVHGADYLQIARWRSVVDPSALAVSDEVLEPPPPDLAAWLTDHGRLRTEAETTSLGGIPAVLISARALHPLSAQSAGCTGTPCVPLAGLRSTQAVLSVTGGQIMRLYVLGEPGRQFVITYAAPPARIDGLDAAAAALLGSLRFAPDR